MANRLRASTSPYLLQHADNPVDWWPWEPAAFEEARRRQVPVLLSVGYAACHWCHVMAHESFEDDEVAQVLNRDFVAIKVDREERPDIDSVYMAATQALTGRGGWPMTCLLTPGGDPFFAGTYFPKPAFLQILAAAHATWVERPDDLIGHAGRIAAALGRAGEEGPGVPLDADVLAGAVSRLAGSYDQARGGFGGAPKFPPSMVLEWLLRHHARTGDQRALGMVEGTCTAMARGGMYDQLAGGFARYAVDADWVVPHFEKMLYDNAQLLAVYLHWWRASGDPLARRVAIETADFMLADLRTTPGGFASSLDADTDGVEGMTYAWTPAQLREVLGPDDGAAAASLLSVTPGGSFDHGSSTLQLRHDPADPEWWARVRTTLREARDRRPQPARDDKVVSAWNGMAIGALAEAGALLDRPDYLDAATRCANHLLATHLVDGRLRRASRDGLVGEAEGVAEDYGNLASGLLTLYQASTLSDVICAGTMPEAGAMSSSGATASAGDMGAAGAAGSPGGMVSSGSLRRRWLEAAGQLLEVALTHFRADDGGFFDTPDDAPALFTRPRTESDNAEPSGQSALAEALLTYGALTGSSAHLRSAIEALSAAGRVAAASPRFGGWALAAAEAAQAGPLQLAIVHPVEGPDERTRQMVQVARHSCSPGLVTVVGPPDAPGVPLLADRPLADGQAAGYVCRGFVCDRPVTDPDQLRLALG